MFHHPAWAVGSHSSGPQPRELPKSKSTQPRFARRWTTLYIYMFTYPSLLQVRTVFLQWIPWVLRMGRPGEKITRKTIMIQNKMKELDLQAKSSKSLLANVLDMDDDFR